MKLRSTFLLCPLIVISWASMAQVRAGDLFWDGNSITADADGGNGTWDTATTSNWDTLAIGGADIQWTAANVAVFSGTAGNVNVTTGTSAQQVKFTSTGYVVGGASLDLTGAGNNAVVVNPGTTATINNNLSKSVGEFWVRGGGTVVLGGTNSINPSLVITEGSTLEFSSLAAVGGSGGLFFNGAAGTIRYTGATDATLARLSVNTSFSLANSTANVFDVLGVGKLTLNDLGGGNGVLTGLTKVGAGTLVLSGVTTYGGATIVNAGSLFYSRAASANYGTSVITNNASVTISPTSLAALAFNSRLSGSGTFTIDGPGGGSIYENRVILKGTATASDNTGPINVINSGKLWLQGVNAVAPSTVIDLGPSTVFSLYSAVNYTIGGLTGTGTVNLSDASGGTPSLTIGGGNTTSTFAGAINNSSGTLAITKTGTGTLTLSGAASHTGATTVSDGSLVFSRTVASTTYSTPVITNNSLVTMSASANAAMFFNSRLSGTGNFSIDGPGGGNIYQNRVVLKGTATASDNTGSINVINSGRLWLEGVNAVAPSTVINLNGANTLLALYGAGTRTIGGLTGTGTVSIKDASGGGPPTLTIGGGDTTSSFSGAIKNDSGSLAIIKIGTGTLTLSGANTYSGNTTVAAGTLSLSTAFLNDSSQVLMTSGAFLNLTTGATDVVAGISLDGNAETTPGVYGSLSSSAQFKRAYITGSGTLTIPSSGGSGNYGLWASDNGIPGVGANVDSDADGITNGIEFVIGGLPAGANSNSNSLLNPPALDGTYLIYTFRRTISSVSYNPGVEYGTNLQSWTPAQNGVNGVIVTVEPDFYEPGIDRVTVKMPRTLANFARLKVTIN